MVKYQDTLMAVRGDGSTGKVGYVSTKLLEGANITANLLRFSANRELIHPLFLYSVLSSTDGQNLITSRITRTAKKTITATELKKMEIPVPPLNIQNKFAVVFKIIEDFQKKQRKSEKQIELLVNSLTRKLLHTQIDLTKIIIQNKESKSSKVPI